MNFFLTMYFSFLLGYSEGGLQLWEPNTIPVQQTVDFVHTNMDAEFRLHYKDVAYAYVGGGMNCSTKKKGGLFEAGGYDPREMDYPFSVGLRIKDHIDIGYKYQCNHPLTTYMCDKFIKYKQEGNYQMVFVKFNGEVRLWK